jgi:glycosyltransferase involved in cell wall biosynthesis
LEVDAVVLYAWGSPKYLGVARAIREAGVRLVLNQDNGGLISPFAGVGGWAREQWLLQGQGRDLKSWLRWGLSLAKGLSLGPLLVDLPRARHLSQGDVIACVSPRATEHYRRMCRRYGGAALAEKVQLLPHAVENRFVWHGEAKSRQVLAVGRWADTNQKRPDLLMAAGGRLLEMDDQVRLVIAGGSTPGLESWRNGLTSQQRERVRLAGVLDRAALAAEMCNSQVFYSPSAFESFGIAAAEALCCGCSVVAQQSVSMSAFDWFVGEHSGRLAMTSSPQEHAEQLSAELRCWEHAQRHPGAISSVWSERLHANRVAGQVLELLDVRGA